MKRDLFHALSIVLSKYDLEININKVYKIHVYAHKQNGCVSRVRSGGFVFITYLLNTSVV
jgi:hypothetical protein